MLSSAFQWEINNYSFLKSFSHNLKAWLICWIRPAVSKNLFIPILQQITSHFTSHVRRKEEKLYNYMNMDLLELLLTITNTCPPTMGSCELYIGSKAWWDVRTSMIEDLIWQNLVCRLGILRAFFLAGSYPRNLNWMFS